MDPQCELRKSKYSGTLKPLPSPPQRARIWCLGWCSVQKELVIPWMDKIYVAPVVRWFILLGLHPCQRGCPSTVGVRVPIRHRNSCFPQAFHFVFDQTRYPNHVYIAWTLRGPTLCIRSKRCNKRCMQRYAYKPFQGMF